MISQLRQQFNSDFTENKYQKFISQIHADWPSQLEFRVAETPVFIDKALKGKLIAACESFVDVIVSPDFKARTDAAIPVNQNVPNENAHT